MKADSSHSPRQSFPVHFWHVRAKRSVINTCHSQRNRLPATACPVTAWMESETSTFVHEDFERLVFRRNIQKVPIHWKWNESDYPGERLALASLSWGTESISLKPSVKLGIHSVILRFWHNFFFFLQDATELSPSFGSTARLRCVVRGDTRHN